jgi:Na+-driven multidrug efflux pump
MKSSANKSQKPIQLAGPAFNQFVIWGICGSLVITLSTIVDSLLVGNIIGSNGLAVSSMSTPVFLIYAFLGFTIGSGASIKIGRLLGASDKEEANRVFSAQLTVGLIVSAILLLPLLFKKSYLSFLGVTDELYSMAEQYITVALWCAPIFIMYYILSNSVRTDGDPKRAAAASGAVIVLNLVLDFVFMKTLNLGIIGASASLCVADTVGTIILLTHFLKKQKLLKLRLSIPTLKDIKDFFWGGFSMGSMYISIAIVMVMFNTLLLKYGGSNGTMLVAIYGVLYTISTVPNGVFEGTSGALTTVTPFLVGESDTEGSNFVFKRALKVAVIAGAGITAVCEAIPGLIAKAFGITSEFAPAAVRMFAISIVFTAINTIVMGYWQSIGRTQLANILALMRNCLLILAFGAIFIPKIDIRGVGASYICAEVLCLIGVIAIKFAKPSKKYIADKYGIKERYFNNDYVIEKESMQQISSDLEKVCDEWEIGPAQSFLINFVCEELLLNIIKFALDGKNKGYYISVKLIEKDGEYVLCVRDNVNQYNPFESKGDEIDSGVLKLIENKAKKCEYQRKLTFNYLYLVI